MSKLEATCGLRTAGLTTKIDVHYPKEVKYDADITPVAYRYAPLTHPTPEYVTKESTPCEYVYGTGPRYQEKCP